MLNRRDLNCNRWPEGRLTIGEAPANGRPNFQTAADSFSACEKPRAAPKSNIVISAQRAQARSKLLAAGFVVTEDYSIPAEPP